MLTVSEAIEQGHQVRHGARDAVLHVGPVPGPGQYGASAPSRAPPRRCAPLQGAARGLPSNCSAAGEEGCARRCRCAASAARADGRTCSAAGQHGPLPRGGRSAGAQGGLQEAALHAAGFLAFHKAIRLPRGAGSDAKRCHEASNVIDW